ncbi:nitroreductase family deazaflavin-dependent oxidoreductase [Microbacterium sp. KUDC0406]|uniref:nitroreductase family deazaflavin-dependent oxidoreductase n=1 Tax=Microbacterium sp. KUDC0406 TaxID=2909588 RepID=UPI001F1A0DCD|nr:nitroreductase family deazaflavin-dependent oxidoreductase [Microbacterium sp. KUDC0406]UJP09614.1 nitroreductase family deazaflavin-dependent oxidoreductase [Microbacterium sp. KUDC0406]
MTGSFREGYLRVLKNTLNPLTLRAARRGRGPFSLVRHIGRTSGTTYETPIILARHPAGFVAELTYGPQVNWYRNIVAAGSCDVVYKGVEHHIDGIGPCSVEDGLKAFGNRGPSSSSSCTGTSSGCCTSTRRRSGGCVIVLDVGRST